VQMLLASRAGDRHDPGFCAISHARAIWLGVAFSRLANRATRSTIGWFAAMASGVKCIRLDQI